MYHYAVVLLACQALLVVANPLTNRYVRSIPLHENSNSPTATAAASDNRNDIVFATYEAGGHHGDDIFDDHALVGNKHYRIGAFKMWCDKPKDLPDGELQAISFLYRDTRNLQDLDAFTGVATHGTNLDAEWERSWTLDLDEYIQSVDVWTYKARGHTRIGTISITTSTRNEFAHCGPKTGTKTTWGGKGQALSYVSGSSGRVVDFLQGHFIDAAAF